MGNNHINYFKANQIIKNNNMDLLVYIWFYMHLLYYIILFTKELYKYIFSRISNMSEE